MDADRSASRLPLRFVLAAAALGILARLAFGLLYWTHQPLTRDELEYLSLARSLTAGHGFVYDEVMRSGPFVPFGRAPGYPLFLTVIGAGRAVVDAVPASVKVAQACVGAIGVLLVGVIANRLAGARAAKAAALVAAVYPPLVWIAGFVWSEAFFWPLGLLVAWLFDRAVAPHERRWTPALICGLVIGLGILTRPALILFLPPAGLLLLARRQWLSTLAMGLGLALVLGPWTFRNLNYHGRLMTVASDGGVTFWTGNHPLAIGEGDMAANSALKYDNQRLRAAHPGLTEEQMEPIYYHEAFAWMRAHPMAWLWLEMKKVFYLIVPIGPSYTLHSMRYALTSIVSYLGLLAFALVGVVHMGRRLGAAPGLWILVASAVLVCLVFFPQERFRIPIIDPALVILGGIGLSTIPALKHRL